MRYLYFILLFTLPLFLVAQPTTVWNPAANAGSSGLWNEAANWTANAVPDGSVKVVLNVPGAQDCRLTDSRSITQFVIGDNDVGENLVIQSGGTLVTDASIWSAIGFNNTGRLVVESGGTVTFGQHMWVGLLAGGDGVVDLNGGTINVSAQTGLGWDGGVGRVNVNDGVLNMAQIAPTQSIGPGSEMSIGSGTVNITGDQVGIVNDYVTAGKITAQGTGVINVTYDGGSNTTIITADGPTPQLTTVWNPAANPSSTGAWSEAANWTDGFVPDGNKVVFNVDNAAAATISTVVPAVRQFVLGDNGPGGLLTVASGGVLTNSVDIWSAVGWNNTAVLTVDAGGTVNFGLHMWIGFEPGSNGTVNLNGGTINVGAQTGLGWNGGAGFVNVNSGVLNMAQIDGAMSIGDGSLMTIDDGTVNITGDRLTVVNAYITAGKIVSADATAPLVVTYDAGTDVTTIIKGAALPAELLSFSATAGDKVNVLSWRVATEENLRHYVIEQSTDGASFTPLASEGARGDFSTYRYTDRNPAGPFYRLRMEDYDGSLAYSDVIQVDRAAFGSLAVYPNPRRGGQALRVRYSGSEETELVVFDATGRRLGAVRLNPDAATPAPLAVMLRRPGAYLLRVKATGETAKLITTN